MEWEKKGLVFRPEGRLAWARSHAFPPTPLLLGDGVLRIYLGFCDENMIGRVGFVDVSADDPREVLRVSERPALDVGPPGHFDENGILPTSAVRVDDLVYLYYVGYQLGQKVRYYQFEGLAISRDGGETFERASRVPVIDRSDAEALNRTSAFVMREHGLFKMWYVGGSEWTMVEAKSFPVYNIRYLESEDGRSWGPEGEVAVDFANDDEHAFGRPYVIDDGGLKRMFYSVRTRSKGYRLGYAESRDGRTWTRKDDEVGITVSPDGWDSKMIAYSSLVRLGDRVLLFYNGNNFGEEGFGYAELVQW